MIRPMDKAVFSNNITSFIDRHTDALVIITCWTLWGLGWWMTGNVTVGLFMVPVLILFFVVAATLLICIAAPLLIVLFYIAAIIAALFLCLFKKI